MRYEQRTLPLPTQNYEGFEILNPATIDYVERDDFIKSLLMTVPPPAIALEDIIMNIYNAHHAYGGKPKVKVSDETVKMAQDYIYYRNLQARLPKFSRWACGMFQGKKDLEVELSAVGKYIENSGDISISGALLDILRCADSPYFYSCFKTTEAYNYMPKLIAECTPGIAIAYVDDPITQKMRGRCWVHHAIRRSDGADVAVICEKQGGTLSARQIGEMIKSKGVDAYLADWQNAGPVEVKYVNCFESNVHHDLATWHPNARVEPL